MLTLIKVVRPCMTQSCGYFATVFPVLSTRSFRSKAIVSCQFQKQNLREAVEDAQLSSSSENGRHSVDIFDSHHNLPSIDTSKPRFPEVIHHVETKVGFWESEHGLALKETALTAVGRSMRLFVSIERYDNWWESTMEVTYKVRKKFNPFDEVVYQNYGPEWAICYLVLKIGGSFKLATDDRWIDDSRNIRTPSKKDCTVEAIDLRKSCLNYNGMKYFDHVGYVRFLTVADSKLFDNDCMVRLHPLADVLEYLDVSGTAVTVESFAYLRLFTKLKWLNISRLSNMPQVEKLVPFIKEILPSDCVVVTNDDLPSLSYGSEIPYRSPKNPSKDVILEEDPGIGDSNFFESKYGLNALQVNDVTPVHQLWKTPIAAPQRHMRLSLYNLEGRYKIESLIEYINKAEKYPPLL